MRLKIVKSILWFLFGIGTITGIARFVFGLGATTNLTDTTPWGLWVGFDVMAGVALAAGGFVLAATVYIFKLEKYHPVVRPAVLTAFLGYVAVAVGLLFDLGLPWNIWHMMIFWNPHSPLFEVGWCVMLYLTVLLLEFAPVVLEKYPKLMKIHGVLVKARIPLVIVGIGLSTLHQSSLGSLLLIMPYRIHPLWYSPIIPVLFLISAVGLGLMMVTLESTVSSWLYRKEHETKILAGLGKAAVYVLGAYAVVRLGDLAIRGQLGLLFAGTWESYIFSFELLISAVLPAALLASPKIRSSRAGLTVSSFMVVAGMVLHRLNASGIAQIRATGTDYIPSLIEFSISLWVVSGAVLVFMYFVEHFKVFEKEAVQKPPQHKMPVFDRPSAVWTDEPFYGNAKRFSLMFVIGAVVGFTFLPEQARNGAEPADIPVQRARITDVLLIDGNRADEIVVFDHDLHKEKNGDDDSCALCHHMRKPLDKYTPCADCHGDMQKDTFIFDHTLHADKLGGNDGCVKCHTNPDAPKEIAYTTDCAKCHTDMRIVDSLVDAPAEVTLVKNYAIGYKDAMHGLCITCHEERKAAVERPDMDQCAFCHKPLPGSIEKQLEVLKGTTISGRTEKVNNN